MRRSLAVGLAFVVIAVFGSVASGAAAAPTIKVVGGGIFVPNAMVAETFHFLPGDITIASGGTLTFVKAEDSPDPHTLTIVNRSQLPKNADQVFACGSTKGDVCRTTLAAHFPKNGPPVPMVDTDSIPGLSAPGDSLFLCPTANAHQSCGKGSTSWIVSAPAGSTLYFFCAIHPWMQGVIHVI